MDKTIKIVAAVLALVVVACLAVLVSGTLSHADSAIVANDTIYFFYGEECTHCHNIMPFIINMTEKYPEADIQILEIWHNQSNSRLYQQANAALGRSPYGVPEVVMGKTVLIGELEIPAEFEGLIQDYLKKKA